MDIDSVVEASRHARRCSRLEFTKCAQQLNTRESLPSEACPRMVFLCARQGWMTLFCKSATFSAPLEPMETHCNFMTERVERIRDVLFKLYLEMGAVGVQWEEVSRDQLPFQRKFLSAIPSKLTLSHVEAITQAWREWCHWCKNVISRFEPSAIQLGVLLQQVSQRGPTVATASPMLHSQSVRLIRQVPADIGRPLGHTEETHETLLTNGCTCPRLQRQDRARRGWLAGCPSE